MIVLDCSAAVNIVRGTVEGDTLKSLILTNEEVISSDLFYIELASAFSKYVKAGFIGADLANTYMQCALRLVDRFVPLVENYVEAFHESIRLNHSVYDLLYLTLARRNAATLLTLDTKLTTLCETQGIDCIHTVMSKREI